MTRCRLEEESFFVRIGFNNIAPCIAMHFNRAAVSGLTVAANVLFVRVIRLLDVHRLHNLRLRFRLSFCFRFSAPSNQEKYSDNRQEITKPLHKFSFNDKQSEKQNSIVPPYNDWCFIKTASENGCKLYINQDRFPCCRGIWCVRHFANKKVSEILMLVQT